MSLLPTVSYPKLRAVDVRPHHQNGQTYYLLRDPLQLTDSHLLVPQEFGPLLAMLDGTRDAHGMSRLFRFRYGLPIDPAQINSLVAALDDALLLENTRYLSAREKMRSTYRAAPFRRSTLAGTAYPAHPDQLATLLDDYLAQVAEPARPDHADAQPPTESPTTGAPSCGVLSPHIDFQRGGLAYAQVWQEAARAARAADLVILFGTDHCGTDPFTLTRQHYATPYGTLPTPFAMVDALADSIGPEDAYAGELRHLGEHSLDLVAVWLHHMRRGKPVELVPILVGGVHAYLETKTHPDDDALVNGVLATLAEVTRNRTVLVVASGDMAHVGPAFGGKPLNESRRATLRAADEELFAHMMAGDRRGFFESIRQVNDRNNVCGITPIYLTMRLLELMGGPIRGHRVAYAVCPADNANTSVVTVGGVVFHHEIPAA